MTMKRSIKRPVLTALASASLAFSLCPFTGIVQAYAEESSTDGFEASEQMQVDAQAQENEQDESQEPANEAHSHNEITFEAWEATDSLPATAGSYYLVNDIVLDGSAWAVPEGATNLCLNGKTIKGTNIAAGGSAVTVRSGADLSLFDCQNAGKITNEGTSVGGVRVMGGGSFTMNAGTITGCTQHGVDVLQNGTFKLHGGSIEGNVSQDTAVGVYVQSGAIVSVSGAPRVVNNTLDGVQHNMRIAADNVVTVDGELSEGASIGITRLDEQNKTITSAFTTGYKAANKTTEPSAFFTSDDSGFAVARTEDGEEARFVTTYYVMVPDGIQNGTVTTSVAKAAEGQTVTVTATPAEGYELEALSVMDAQNNAVEVTNNTFVMPASDVTVAATFKATAAASVTHTIVFDANGGQGSMDPQTMVAGEVNRLAANTYTRTNYTFAGWNTKADGTGAAFRDGASVKLNSDVTLYAQWKDASTTTTTGNKPTTTGNSTTTGSKTATTGNNSTTATATKAATSSALANTADSVSVAAVAATAVSGVAVVVAGSRKKR